MFNEKFIDIYTLNYYTNFHGFKDFLRGADLIASKLGYEINIVDSRSIPVNEYINLYHGQKKKFVLVLGTNIYCERKIIAEFKMAQIPFLIVGRTHSGICDVSTVSIDFKTAAADITNHLINTGRKRIAFMGLNSTTIVDFEKLEGYKAALLQNGLSFDESYVFDYGSRTLYEAICNFAGRSGLFDAVVCSTDAIAILVMKAMNSQGISVPETIAVTGFDNLKIGSLIEPGLTTVKVFFEDYGKSAIKAVNLLQQDISLRAVKLISRHQVVPRGSCSMSSIQQVSGQSGNNCLYIDYLERDHYFAGSKIRSTVNVDRECFYNDDNIVNIEKIEDLFCTIDLTEMKILKMLISGMYYKEVASQLFMSEATVKYHIKKMLNTVNASNARELLSLLKQYLDVKQLKNLREDIKEDGV